MRLTEAAKWPQAHLSGQMSARLVKFQLCMYCSISVWTSKKGASDQTIAVVDQSSFTFCRSVRQRSVQSLAGRTYMAPKPSRHMLCNLWPSFGRNRPRFDRILCRLGCPNLAEHLMIRTNANHPKLGRTHPNFRPSRPKCGRSRPKLRPTPAHVTSKPPKS